MAFMSITAFNKISMDIVGPLQTIENGHLRYSRYKICYQIFNGDVAQTSNVIGDSWMKKFINSRMDYRSGLEFHKQRDVSHST